MDVPIAVGERHSHIWGLREHIERELVDVIQPDAGRVGGISQLKKLAAMAEAHYITVAPHSGTLGPVGEYAALARHGVNPQRPGPRTGRVRPSGRGTR